MEWKPIQRSKQRVLGVHPQYRGLLEVEVELSQRPPAEWGEAFLHPEGVEVSVSMHRPRLSGSIIYITPPDDQVEEYVRHVDERISAANATYEQRILPRARIAEDAENRSRDEERRRLEEAKKRLQGL